MRAKSGLHTSKGKRNADTSQQKAVGEKQQKPPPGPTGEAGAETGAATVSRGPNASQQADVVAGTRVRLRDSGRLGTVVGKKAGGWWIVDLAESWGAVAGDVGGVPSAGMNRTLSSVSSSSPITTRRVNMEPLGKAYAAPSSDASGAVRKAPAVSGAAAGVALPSILRGQTISLDTMATAGAKVAEPIMIRTLSGDGLEHAGMKEWLVFSDLHVGPGTLNVSLEVSTPQGNRTQQLLHRVGCGSLERARHHEREGSCLESLSLGRCTGRCTGDVIWLRGLLSGGTLGDGKSRMLLWFCTILASPTACGRSRSLRGSRSRPRSRLGQWFD